MRNFIDLNSEAERGFALKFLFNHNYALVICDLCSAIHDYDITNVCTNYFSCFGCFFFAYFAQLRFKLFKVASKPNEENNNTLMRVEWTLITAHCEVKVQKPARINDTKK